MKKEDIKQILIIGMAGGLAKLTADVLNRTYPDAEIVGVDPRKIEHAVTSSNIRCERMSYTRGNFEKLFRNNQFDVVYHLGRVTHANANPRANLVQRLDLNIIGTKRVLDLCLSFGIKKVVVLSTYHVYGAYPDNPVFLKEDAPLRATIKFPELHDVVEMDQIATNWMWKNQRKVETLVFRPCSIIGPQIKNAMTSYLLSSYSPLPIDFNPMVQYIHVYDMAHLLATCLEGLPTGVYNVAPEEVISLRDAKELINTRSIPIPIMALELAAKIIKKTFFSIPDYLIEYLKYPCLLDSSELRCAVKAPMHCRYTTSEALEMLQLK